MSYGTIYRVFKDENSKSPSIGDLTNTQACFSSYVNRGGHIGNFGKCLIEVKILKDYSNRNVQWSEMLFNSQQVKLHCAMLSMLGFKNYLKEFGDCYIVSFYEREYICFGMIRFALDHIRALWEKDINQVIVAYYNLEKKYRENITPDKYLKTLYEFYNLTHSLYYSGHSLPQSSSRVLVGKKQVSDGIKKKTVAGTSYSYARAIEIPKTKPLYKDIRLAGTYDTKKPYKENIKQMEMSLTKKEEGIVNRYMKEVEKHMKVIESKKVIKISVDLVTNEKERVTK